MEEIDRVKRDGHGAPPSTSWAENNTIMSECSQESGHHQSKCALNRGGHRHMQVGRLADANLIPDIWSKGLNIVIFRTTEGKNRDLYIDKFWSVPNPIHFQCKKNRDLYPIFQNFINFVKNFLHVILFLGMGDIPEEICGLAQLATNVLPSPPPLPAPPPPP